MPRSSTRTLGNGHVVMFAIRPFWRWQTQGTFFLGFNAILNWNDLDAGKARRAPRRVSSSKEAAETQRHRERIRHEDRKDTKGSA